MNPYDVLGLPITCTMQDIKRAYKRLALLNHPDKLHSGYTSDERASREEEFKRITVAYHILLEQHDSYDNEVGNTREYWSDIWTKMEAFLSKQNIWATMFDVATKYMRVKYHKVQLPATLEEIYTNKIRKVEFTLKGVEDPIRTEICCGDYPETSFNFEDPYERHHQVIVAIRIINHDVYEIDNDNLYASLYITWQEHLEGCIKNLPFLDGTCIDVPIPPCMDILESIVIPGKGINSDHDLFVDIRISGIQMTKWSALTAGEQSNMIRSLRKLSD